MPSIIGDFGLFGIAGGGGSSSNYESSSSSYSSGSSWSSHDSSWSRESRTSRTGSNQYASVAGQIIIIVLLAYFAWVGIKKILGHHNNLDSKKENFGSRKTIQSKNEATESLYDFQVTPRPVESLESKEIVSLLIDKIKTVFISYQNDWSSFDIVAMRTYQTEKYFNHACLMLELLKSMNRQNVVSDVIIRDIEIDANRFYKTDKSFLATIHFSCTDELYDLELKKRLVYEKLTNYEETWEFERDDQNNIKINAIYQSKMMSFSHLNKNMQNFADKNHLYYSPDWGTYALPSCGLIFNSASLRYADINNHVIGKWKNTLVQLYTYSPSPTVPGSYWLVGSLTVPRRYGGIILRHRSSKDFNIPKGYERYQMEWEQFNETFEVWSTNLEKITSFELVNPKFMAYLVDNELSFNLEVVENNIYIFTHCDRCDEDNYAVLLTILSEAFKELN